MARKEELTIEIDKNGKLSGDVVAGPGGKGCLDMLEEVLGGIGAKTSQANKPEIYQNRLPAKSGQTIKR